MSFGGVVLRFGGLFLRFLQFCCAGVAVAIFSYFLAVLADHNLPIEKKWQATEGLTGAATLYALFGVIFTLCLGGNSFFGFIAIVLDILFIGAFVVVAIFTKHGASSCNGYVVTPLGSGNANSKAEGYGTNGFGFGNGQDVTYYPNLRTACRLNTTVFAVSIAACLLFFFSALWQIMMVRHHKKEKRYGPGPNNNYTSGSGKVPFWKRRQARRNRDLETTGAVGAGGIGATRASHETSSTLGNNAAFPEQKYESGHHNRF